MPNFAKDLNNYIKNYLNNKIKTITLDQFKDYLNKNVKPDLKKYLDYNWIYLNQLNELNNAIITKLGPDYDLKTDELIKDHPFTKLKDFLSINKIKNGSNGSIWFYNIKLFNIDIILNNLSTGTGYLVKINNSKKLEKISKLVTKWFKITPNMKENEISFNILSEKEVLILIDLIKDLINIKNLKNKSKNFTKNNTTDQSPATYSGFKLDEILLNNAKSAYITKLNNIWKELSPKNIKELEKDSLKYFIQWVENYLKIAKTVLLQFDDITSLKPAVYLLLNNMTAVLNKSIKMNIDKGVPLNTLKPILDKLDLFYDNNKSWIKQPSDTNIGDKVVAGLFYNNDLRLFYPKNINVDNYKTILNVNEEHWKKMLSNQDLLKKFNVINILTNINEQKNTDIKPSENKHTLPSETKERVTLSQEKLKDFTAYVKRISQKTKLNNSTMGALYNDSVCTIMGKDDKSVYTTKLVNTEGKDIIPLLKMANELPQSIGSESKSILKDIKKTDEAVIRRLWTLSKSDNFKIGDDLYSAQFLLKNKTGMADLEFKNLSFTKYNNGDDNNKLPFMICLEPNRIYVCIDKPIESNVTQADNIITKDKTEPNIA